MSKHSDHGHHQHGSSPESAGGSLAKGLQRRWVLIVGVVLMLAAMGIYVLTMSEALEPAPVEEGPEFPAAAE